MRYEVAESANTLGEWRVEAIDNENDGAIHVTLFSGPNARSRAEEYAAWKSAPTTKTGEAT